MTAKGWHRRFDDPIPLPDGRTLTALRDAATYITKPPKREARRIGMAPAAIQVGGRRLRRRLHGDLARHTDRQDHENQRRALVVGLQRL